MAARRTKATRGRKPRKDRAQGPPAELEALAEFLQRHGLHEVELLLAPDGTRQMRLTRHAVVHHGPPAPAAPAHVASGPDATPARGEPGEKLHAFKSPMVGTFYRAPSPEASPFVSVGDHVEPGTTVCIIEAMKVMNEISPDVRGEIASIEVENGEAVEFGQALFLIRPS